MMVLKNDIFEKIPLETSDKVVGFISENERSHLELVLQINFQLLKLFTKKKKVKIEK